LAFNIELEHKSTSFR